MEKPAHQKPKAATEAETLARDFKEFTYLVSHDLGAPVRGMVEFSRLLKSEHLDALNDDGKLYLSIIIDSGQKLQAMLAGLTDYSRLNAAAKPPAVVNLNNLLDDCRLTLKTKIESAAAVIDASELPTLSAEPDQLRKLFLVLLDNALTFRRPDMALQIHISAKRDGRDYVFSVTDNGIGIEPQFSEQVFKPFKRLHADTEYPGVGMGLALAKKIVERHGGRIWVESAQRQGTTVCFRLPQE